MHVVECFANLRGGFLQESPIYRRKYPPVHIQLIQEFINLLLRDGYREVLAKCPGLADTGIVKNNNRPCAVVAKCCLKLTGFKQTVSPVLIFSRVKQ